MKNVVTLLMVGMFFTGCLFGAATTVLYNDLKGNKECRSLDERQKELAAREDGFNKHQEMMALSFQEQTENLQKWQQLLEKGAEAQKKQGEFLEKWGNELVAREQALAAMKNAGKQ